MATVFDIDREFVDKLVIALAAKHEGKKPSKKDVEAWFKYAAAVAIAREEFWRAHSEAMYGAESDS